MGSGPTSKCRGWEQEGRGEMREKIKGERKGGEKEGREEPTPPMKKIVPASMTIINSFLKHALRYMVNAWFPTLRFRSSVSVLPFRKRRCRSRRMGEWLSGLEQVFRA